MILVEEVRSLRYFKAIDKVERKVLCDLKLLFFLERQKKNAIKIVLLDRYTKQQIENDHFKDRTIRNERRNQNRKTYSRPRSWQRTAGTFPQTFPIRT